MRISANSLEAAQRFSAASDIDILDTDADIYHHGTRSASPPEALGMVWGSPQEALENPWGALGKLVGSLRALKRKRGFDGSTRAEPARARKDRKKEEKTQWWQAPSSSTAWVQHGHQMPCGNNMPSEGPGGPWHYWTLRDPAGQCGDSRL